jgi:hypothetical protein
MTDRQPPNKQLERTVIRRASSVFVLVTIAVDSANWRVVTSREVLVKQFIVSVLLLAVIPMLCLNPLGREAFLGYYLGVIATWIVFVSIGRFQNFAQAPGEH